MRQRTLRALPALSRPRVAARSCRRRVGVEYDHRSMPRTAGSLHEIARRRLPSRTQSDMREAFNAGSNRSATSSSR